DCTDGSRRREIKQGGQGERVTLAAAPRRAGAASFDYGDVPTAKAGEPPEHPGLPYRRWVRPPGTEPVRKGTSVYPHAHWIAAGRPVPSGSSRSCWAFHRAHKV